MNKSSITTKVGDHGTTFLFSGEEVSKDCPRTEAYGDLDELVSVLGVARVQSRRAEVRDVILKIQCDLFIAGAEMATGSEHTGQLAKRVDGAMLQAFELQRDELEARIKMPDGFILPGGSGSLAAAQLDQARTIARRVERRAVALARSGLIRNEALLIWLNRLSDYLWLLARFEEKQPLTLKEARANP